MAKRHTPEDFEAIIAEMNEAPPRSAILVGTSLLEHALEDFIQASLRPATSSAERNKLFSVDGILGSFSSKIWMAYFLRLIGPTTRRELDIIRAVRNDCAHNMNAVSFEKDPTASRCRDLAGQRQPRLVLEQEPGKIFMATIQLFVGAFFKAVIVRHVGHPADPLPELQHLLQIIEA